MKHEPCVVVAYDGHGHGPLRLGAYLAEILDLPLRVVTAYRYEADRPDLTAQRFAAAERIAGEAARFLEDSPLVEAVSVPGSDTTSTLKRHMRQVSAALVVIGPDTRGQVTSGMLNVADCAVVVCPSNPLLVTTPFRRIVSGFDDSAGAQHALAAADALALATGADLEVVGVGGGLFERRALTPGLSRAVEETAAPARWSMLEGRPVEELRLATEDADLLCCGSRARPRFAGRLLGSVSARLVADPPCPVLVTPPHLRLRPGQAVGLTYAGE